LINNIKAITNTIQVDVVIGAQGAYVKKGELQADTIYKVEPGFVFLSLLKVPKIRVFVWNFLKKRLLKRIINETYYDYVVFHSLPIDINRLVPVAQSKGARIILFPWGSDVLRAKENIRKKIDYAFGKADYIRGDNEQFINNLMIKYPHVRMEQFVDLSYASPVISNIAAIKKESIRKEDLLPELGFPKERYYIVCGYNAYYGQQHKKMIEKIAQVKEQLPSNYLLVFPLSYGHESGVSVADIETWCNEFNLKYYCITQYLTDYQMACLHLIADVFIHIQLTDASNAFIIEALCSNTKVINGTWLHYPKLEKHGCPFYKCSSLDVLSTVLIQTINSDSDVIPERLKEEFILYTWPVVANRWVKFLNS
jgi:hypothetical protein